MKRNFKFFIPFFIVVFFYTLPDSVFAQTPVKLEMGLTTAGIVNFVVPDSLVGVSSFVFQSGTVEKNYDFLDFSGSSDNFCSSSVGGFVGSGDLTSFLGFDFLSHIGSVPDSFSSVDCTVAGTYYLSLKTDTGDLYYGQFEYDGTFLFGDNLASSAFPSSIVSFSPSDGFVTASTTVTLSADVFFNSVQDFGILTDIEFNLANIETQFQYLPFVFPINSSGTSTYATTTVLDKGQHFMVVSFLDATGDRFGSRAFEFTVFSSQFDFALPPFSTLDPSAVATSSSFFFSFLNVPALLRTKVPTAYVYDIVTLVKGLDSSSTSSLGSVSFDFAVIGSGTPLSLGGTVTLFSTSTVSQLFPSGLLSVLRFLMVSVIYVSGAMYVFRKLLSFS